MKRLSILNFDKLPLILFLTGQNPEAPGLWGGSRCSLECHCCVGQHREWDDCSRAFRLGDHTPSAGRAPPSVGAAALSTCWERDEAAAGFSLGAVLASLRWSHVLDSWQGNKKLIEYWKLKFSWLFMLLCGCDYQVCKVI